MRAFSDRVLSPTIQNAPARATEAGGGGGGGRSGGVGPPRPVRSPKGCDSGVWVTELERPPPPTTGPASPRAPCPHEARRDGAYLTAASPRPTIEPRP